MVQATLFVILAATIGIVTADVPVTVYHDATYAISDSTGPDLLWHRVCSSRNGLPGRRRRRVHKLSAKLFVLQRQRVRGSS